MLTRAVPDVPDNAANQIPATIVLEGHFAHLTYEVKLSIQFQSSPPKVLRYANCGQAVKFLGVEYAICGQRFRPFAFVGANFRTNLDGSLSGPPEVPPPPECPRKYCGAPSRRRQL
ncbi:hypothetical protein ARMSODRAFT_967662 [Armillaria solidipes]|uniref:Uncharacterized protein n=1 Tax=Armillaria solidipes TaxID=1076256 RepID=A0A2H3B1M4_9AGAR|nr:hypothetical protein ARMSODRAFT_967662 [Armillaria solidipes]